MTVSAANVSPGSTSRFITMPSSGERTVKSSSWRARRSTAAAAWSCSCCARSKACTATTPRLIRVWARAISASAILSRARASSSRARGLAIVKPGHHLALLHHVSFVRQELGDPARDGRAEPRVIDRFDDAGRIDGFDGDAAGWVGRSDWRRLKQPSPGARTRAPSPPDVAAAMANHRPQRCRFEGCGGGIAAGSRAGLDGTINSAVSGSGPRVSVAIAGLPIRAPAFPLTPAEAECLTRINRAAPNDCNRR